MTNSDLKLPAGWEQIELRAILNRIEAGKSPKAQGRPAKDNEFGVLKVSAVSWGEFRSHENKALLPEQTIDGLPTVHAGDLLISRANTVDLVGAVVLANEDYPNLMLSDKTLRLVPIDRGVTSKFLLYALRTKAVRDHFEDRATGTSDSMRNISQAKIRSAPILLPPLNEQRRIVDRIEALTARSRRAREALTAMPQLIEQFRQSVLAAAFRGDLTADWRKQNPNIESTSKLLEQTALQLGESYPETMLSIDRNCNLLPQTWAWAKLKLVVRHIQPGKNFSCPEIPVNKDTVGLVKISAVTWGEFNPKETKTVIDPNKVNPDLFIKSGDLLVSRANTLELVGASVVVDNIDYKIMLSDKVWRVDLIAVDKKYVHYYLKSPFGRKEIESRATGNQLSMRNISQKAFKDIIIPIPPLDEQREIVRYLENTLFTLNSILKHKQETLEDLNSLDRAILAKAFRGELVPQDSDDEPASVLLERIRAEREKLKPAQKKRRSRRQPKATQLPIEGLDL